MKRSFYLYLLLLFILYDCSTENDSFQNTEAEAVSVRFSSVLYESDIFRAVGSTWEPDDEIGVFAIAHQSTLAAGNIIDNNDNLPFVTSAGNGFFYPRGKNIYYPEKNASMDIIAYYPYRGGLTDYQYPVDITGQPEIFYSKNLTDVHKEQVSNNGLQFRRILSRIVCNITSEVTGGSLEGLTGTITGAKTRASFSLSDGTLAVDDLSVGAVPMTLSGDHSQKQASAILLPTEAGDEITIQFAVDGKTYRWNVPYTLEAGKVYRFDMRLDGLAPSLSGSYMEMPVYSSGSAAPNSAAALHSVGNISWLNSDHTAGSPSYIRNYSILFDTENRVPYWVAFPMHPVYMKSGNRTDDWDYDPVIPKSVQPNLYKGWNNNTTLNRGHLLASADRSATEAINKTTFYFTNMAPQNSSMNSGVWSSLENKVRSWSLETSTYDTLYVVTGCILPKPPEQITYVNDNDGKQSVIPKYLYKALLRKNKNSGLYTSIVFKMENSSSATGYTDSRNIFSVAELENETGFTFFPNLPKNIADEVKSNKSLSNGWN